MIFELEGIVHKNRFRHISLYPQVRLKFIVPLRPLILLKHYDISVKVDYKFSSKYTKKKENERPEICW